MANAPLSRSARNEPIAPALLYRANQTSRNEAMDSDAPLSSHPITERTHYISLTFPMPQKTGTKPTPPTSTAAINQRCGTNPFLRCSPSARPYMAQNHHRSHKQQERTQRRPHPPDPYAGARPGQALHGLHCVLQPGRCHPAPYTIRLEPAHSISYSCEERTQS